MEEQCLTSNQFRMIVPVKGLAFNTKYLKIPPLCCKHQGVTVLQYLQHRGVMTPLCLQTARSLALKKTPQCLKHRRVHKNLKQFKIVSL